MSRHHLQINRRRWEVVRRAVFDRDDWRCRRVRPSWEALECDHVRAAPKAGGEPWALDNLQTLCRGCHVAKTATENRHRRELASRVAGVVRRAAARAVNR